MPLKAPLACHHNAQVMAELRIRTYGDPCLKEKSVPVQEIDDELKRLIREMAEIMYEARGIGLAAPQVAVGLRLFISDIEWVEEEGDRSKETAERNLKVFINPEITWESAEDAPKDEGCLSVPEIEGEVYRPVAVRMRYLDEEGREHQREIEGLEARCVQHELDHLDGVLFIDRLAPAKRRGIAGRLNRLRKRTRAAAGV